MNKAVFIAALLTALVAAAPEPWAAAERNHMGQESSPYLRLHASDPVHWHAWNAETLAQAKAAGKPILLSIGYSSCHWCHVMRREAFSDNETTATINRLFFPILLDREERPDLDSIFQSAAAMSLPTGWPLNMFLTPGAKPFWGGTYFPMVALRGMKPFKDILKQVSGIYTDDPGGVEENAREIAQFLKRSSEPGPGTITPERTDAAARKFLKQIDPFHGGFGEGPKFPYTVALEMLWRAYLRTGDKAFAEAVTATLTHMGRGGIYDHVGGGFFRYAVDPRWLVPHYEKMLDVNAILVRLMTDVWRETGDGALKRMVRETVGFLLSELRLANGAFAGSLDADSLTSEGEEREGAFYLWSEKEILDLLGGDGPLFVAAYGLAAPENALGEDLGDAGTLYRSEQPLDMLAATFKLSPGQVEKRLRQGLAALKRKRETRHRPRRDDKILADWSGLAVAAVAEAGMAFQRLDWIGAATKAFGVTAKALTDGQGQFKDRLRHSALGESRGAPATLGGLAELSRSALILFEATGVRSYLEKAGQWAKQARVHLWDNKDAGGDDGGDGGFFSTALDAGPALVRLKPVMDDPNTSGNAKMAEVLALLYYLNGDADFRDLAEKTLKAFGGAAGEPVLEMSGLFNAADILDATLQIVIVGRRGDAAADKLIGRVMATSLPNRALDVIKPGTVLPEGHPARYKDQIDGRATAYVCRGRFVRCRSPGFRS
jgi:uncharacterized protein YyaL (SSP411 family)